MGIKVKAKRLCYYDLKRRKPGQIFEIESMKEFSKEGMILVSKDAKSAPVTRGSKSKVKPLEPEVLEDSDVEEVEDEGKESSDDESTSDQDVL